MVPPQPWQPRPLRSAPLGACRAAVCAPESSGQAAQTFRRSDGATAVARPKPDVHAC